MTLTELRSAILLDLLRKSSVNGHTEQSFVDELIQTAIYMADQISSESEFSMPSYIKRRPGTVVTLGSSGMTAAISLASVASVTWGSATTTGARQAVTIDLADSAGNIPDWIDIYTEFELAATPTAGNVIQLFGFFWTATGASLGGSTGTDAAYTGINNNCDASLLGAVLLGTHRCTANATATVQKLNSDGFAPKGRYLNLIVRNMSGASFHSTNTNQKITLQPWYNVLQATESGA
jgi:hypothetical protein